MYFANNEGLLSFDGNSWKTYPLPNKTNVRSLEIGPDNRIYIGAQDEIGYFSPNKNGVLVYTSLRYLIPEKERSFADVWDIVTLDNDIFFRSESKIFQLSGNKITVYPNSGWRFMGLSNHILMAQTAQNDLLSFHNGMWEPFVRKNSLGKDFLVTGFLSLGKDTSVIVTLKNGIYYLANDAITPIVSSDLKNLSGKRLYSACSIDNDRMALGTTSEGCVIIDRKGNVIQSYSISEGLQNSNILSVTLDRDKNLWLGLDNGIDFVTYNSAIKHIYPDVSGGSGYTSYIYHNELYLGTSNGLYKVPLYTASDISFVKGRFEPVANTKGQVWNLSEVNGKLMMGHHEGAYLIDDNKATAIDNSTGFWTFLPLYNVLPSNIVVAGTYNGINFYRYNNGTFGAGLTPARFESARFITIDGDHTIWVGHPYKGIFKIQFYEGKPPVVKLYNNKNGLFSVNDNYIYKVRNRIAITTANGIYEYKEDKDKFEVSDYFKSIFGSLSIRYIKEDQAGNLWFIHDKSLGVVDMSGPKPKIIYIPELANKMVSGFEHIYPIDANNILLGAEKGFYHINYSQYLHNNSQLQVQIRTVKAINNTDSLLFGGYYGEVNEIKTQPSGMIPHINHDWNSFHFEYSSTLYGQQQNIEYSYNLKGFDNNWSSWSKKTEKEYTNLPAGSYTFQVKARNNLGNESVVSNYSFVVQPPWYLTFWAYGAYLIILGIAIYFFHQQQMKKFLVQQRKFEEEQKQLQYLHQLEMEKTEKELIKLRNEKLEAEIQHKNTELASAAMHLVQKGELLGKIKEEMGRLKKTQDKGKDPEDLKKIMKILSEEDRMDESWEQFAMHFDKVHSDFLVRLKEHCPSLTANEMKLCAYLKMNLSTKEIAQLMNISVRGVEISRYRLRKKLQIPTEMNLFNYLLNVHTGKSTGEVKEKEL